VVAGEDDDEFNVSANATRLGLRIEGPHDVSYVTGATVEADFYGGGSENTPRPRLRHAFFEVTWPETGWDLLVGQSWDVVHPLSPGQLNFVVGWFSGNIGYRRPQVRVSKRIVTGERSAVTVAAAVARTLGDPLFAQDVGADAGVPTGQLRVAVDAPGLAGRTLTFGVSGHVGEQECDDIDRTVRTWSAGVDLSLPLTERVRLEGEAWTGQAVCTYLGGIGQGVNPVLRRAIRATGGWLALKARPAPAWEVNLGWGMDDPWNRDLNDGQRSRNTSFFANAIYRFLESFHVGLELMYMRTEYRNLEGGASLRAMTQARFTF
jgi:hypothetical protein